MPFVMRGKKLFTIGVDQIGSNSPLKPFSCSFLKQRKLNTLHVALGSWRPVMPLGSAGQQFGRGGADNIPVQRALPRGNQ